MTTWTLKQTFPTTSRGRNSVCLTNFSQGKKQISQILLTNLFVSVLLRHPKNNEDGLEDPWLMSFSHTGSNVTVVFSRDTLTTAIVKNVITVVLFIFISYVNSSLVHIFTKHQVG